MVRSRCLFLLCGASLIACAGPPAADATAGEVAAATTRIASQAPTTPVTVAAAPPTLEGAANAPIELGYVFVERTGQTARITNWSWAFRGAAGTKYAEIVGPQYTSAGPSLAPRATLRWSARILLDAAVVAAARQSGEPDVAVVTQFLGLDAAGKSFSIEARHNVRLR